MRVHARPRAHTKRTATRACANQHAPSDLCTVFQLQREKEEDEVEQTIKARERHAELQEQERAKRLKDIERRRLNQRLLQSEDGGKSPPGGGFPPPEVPAHSEMLLQRILARTSDRILSALSPKETSPGAAPELLLALTRRDVFVSDFRGLRIEKLADISKVTSSPHGDLELVVRAGWQGAIIVEAGLFDMEKLQGFFSLLAEVHEKVRAHASVRSCAHVGVHECLLLCLYLPVSVCLCL